MRCFLCASFLIFGWLSAEFQEAQIIQTYVYPASLEDFTQEIKNGQVEIKIRSKGLLDFMSSSDNKDHLRRQIVKMNTSYTEFKSLDQIVHAYANSLNSKLRFNRTYNIYELEDLGDKHYRIKNIDGLIGEERQCDFVIQKTLRGAIDSKKDFVINLDNFYYFNKVVAAQFLQCVRIAK